MDWCERNIGWVRGFASGGEGKLFGYGLWVVVYGSWMFDGRDDGENISKCFWTVGVWRNEVDERVQVNFFSTARSFCEHFYERNLIYKGESASSTLLASRVYKVMQLPTYF